MRRISRMGLVVATLTVALASCFDPVPVAVFDSLSASELTVAAGASGSVTVTYVLRCESGPGTTADGCAVRGDDGGVVKASLHLAAGVVAPYTYFDGHAGEEVTELGWTYLGHPYDELPDGLTVSFGPEKLVFEPEEGASASSTVTIDVGADVPAGTYTVWVNGLTHRESSAQPITVHVVAAERAHRLTGVVVDWPEAWSDGRVQAAPYGSGDVASDGSFALDLAVPEVERLAPLSFEGCTVEGGAVNGALHTGAGLAVEHDGEILPLLTVEAPYLEFLLYVDRAIDVRATCGAHHYAYAFARAGWYGVHVEGSGGTYRYGVVPVLEMDTPFQIQFP